MNCEEALSLLYEIIDKEASQIDIQQVEDHLKRCRDCFGKYELEKSIQGLINTRLKNDDPLPALDGLRARVATRLDEVDHAGRIRASRTAFRALTLTLASAAALAIVIGAVYVVSGFVRHNREYVPFERAHWTAQNDPAARTASDDPGGTALAQVRNHLNYALDDQVNGFALLGGFAEDIAGVPMQHFVYTRGTSVVSVFVTSADRYAIPDDLKSTEIVRNSLHFFDHNCRTCRLVFHQVGPAIIITAATDPAIELLDFVPGHSPI
jgi:anti-sigma factor (TIGR02949 family)